VGARHIRLLIGAWLSTTWSAYSSARRPARLAAAAGLVILQTWLSTGLFIIARRDARYLAPARPRWNRAVAACA
jgi:hypothetical protein